jgi:hypothetical protein
MMTLLIGTGSIVAGIGYGMAGPTGTARAGRDLHIMDPHRKISGKYNRRSLLLTANGNPADSPPPIAFP